ncbi:MAG: hypothetical protein U5K30_06940 [Acidimicrobiales bacterium]|nr:hypothetical protein [Acidimicrobiales bacterium]
MVDAQRQAARMLTVALVFTATAPVAAVVPHDTGAWLPLHLFLVGGLVSAIAGVTQMLAVTWSTAPAPPDGLAATQRWLMVAGVLAIVAGRELDVVALLGGGGVAVAVVVVSLWVSLVRIRGVAATDRFHPAIDGYLIAFAWALVGVLAGIALAADQSGAWWARVRDAHIAVNVFGLVGTVIVATLPYFVATQARMKMSRRATPLRMRTVSVSTAVAVACAVGGHLGELPGLSGAGYLAYALVLVASVSHLRAVRSRQLRWAGPRLVQLGMGVAWWIGGTVALALDEFGVSVDRTAVLRVIALGGFAQILVASFAYLGPVLRAGGHERLTAGFATTRSWVSLVAANVAAVSLTLGAEAAALAALGIWVLDTVVRAIVLFGLPARVRWSSHQ